MKNKPCTERYVSKGAPWPKLPDLWGFECRLWIGVPCSRSGRTHVYWIRIILSHDLNFFYCIVWFHTGDSLENWTLANGLLLLQLIWTRHCTSWVGGSGTCKIMGGSIPLELKQEDYNIFSCFWGKALGWRNVALCTSVVFLAHLSPVDLTAEKAPNHLQVKVGIGVNYTEGGGKLVSHVWI